MEMRLSTQQLEFFLQMMKISFESFRLEGGLKTLISLHLDELNALAMAKKDVLDSIQFLDIFLSYHIEGLKKVNSMDMVRSIVNEEKEKYNFSI